MVVPVLVVQAALASAVAVAVASGRVLVPTPALAEAVP